MKKPISQMMGGFTLLEILVALIILSVGLLGLAGLQASGLRSNHSGYLRSQATLLAYEMTDRMRANRSTALAENYDLLFSGSTPTGTTIQDIDRAEWRSALNSSLPSGSGQIDCTSTGLCTIDVRWIDNRTIDPSDPDYNTKAYATFTMTTQL
jgi:type IV pilus assembly protein PilV